MKGSVTKYVVKGTSRPRWRYRIDAGRAEGGRRLQEGRGGFVKEAEALTAMRQHMLDIQARARGPAIPEQKITFGEWIQRWLDTYAVDRCQPKTLERYRQLVAYVLKGSDDKPSDLANSPLSDLSHKHLEAALYGLLKAKGKRRAHVSARTVRHVAGVLNVALNKAFRLELLPFNPMLRVELPTTEKKHLRSLTPDEIRSLRGTCRTDWTFAFVELALAVGARRGELLALEWADVDWQTSTLTISKSLEQTKAGLRIKRPKNDKSRSCRLPQSAVQALRFLRDEQAEHRRSFGHDYRDFGLVFCLPDGNRYEPDLVSQVIIRRMKKAGIKNASLHTLRHTHASNLLSSGVPLPAISARLGHCDPNVTARIYSHALPGDDQRAADAWDDIINGTVQ